MSNKILVFILGLSSILSIAIFFIYRGFGWPFGREAIEAIGAFLLYVSITICFYIYAIRFPKNILLGKGIKLGLLLGLLWTLEICMNNLLRPGLPARDLYDNLFWAVIAVILLIASIRETYQTNKIKSGIKIGLWSGFSSGAVASITALCFIVFGMSQLLLDPLNIAEWSQVSATSNTPSIAVYFAYQTLAGAVLHLTVLGVLMGLILGIVGGMIGKSLFQIWRSHSH